MRASAPAARELAGQPPPPYRSPYRTPYRSLNLRLNVLGRVALDVPAARDGRARGRAARLLAARLARPAQAAHAAGVGAGRGRGRGG